MGSAKLRGLYLLLWITGGGSGRAVQCEGNVHHIPAVSTIILAHTYDKK